MKKREIILSGFGGQGVMSIGKNLAEAGVVEGLEVSWVPSYGPEMRGGTANCSIILSDVQVGSPIVSKPDILVAMNLPSLDKYEKEAKPGASIFVDTSLISRKVERDDVNVYYIPATQMSTDNGLDTLANMILLGHVIEKTGVIPEEMIRPALEKVVSARHAWLLEKNIEALNLGKNYKG